MRLKILKIAILIAISCNFGFRKSKLLNILPLGHFGTIKSVRHMVYGKRTAQTKCWSQRLADKLLSNKSALNFCVEHVEAKRYQKVIDHRRSVDPQIGEIGPLHLHVYSAR